MSKIVIHIGTHKTATTMLQEAFWHNSDHLAKYGLIYPHTSKKVTGHHGLVFYWKNMGERYQLSGGPCSALAKISEKYANTDSTVFISSEEFSRAYAKPSTNFIELREMVSAFDEIEVICVLRTQWQFMQSAYLEISKRRVAPRPGQLVNQAINNGIFQGLWVDYNQMLTKLEEAFSPEEITFFDYDTIRRSEGGILGAFLRHLDLGLDASALKVVNGGVTNISPMALASWAANILSEPNAAPLNLVRRAEAVMRAEYGNDVRTCLFSLAEFKKLEDHFSEKNISLQSRRAAMQPDFSITPPNVEDLTLFRQEISGAFWMQLCRKLIAKPYK